MSVQYAISCGIALVVFAYLAFTMVIAKRF